MDKDVYKIYGDILFNLYLISEYVTYKDFLEAKISYTWSGNVMTNVTLFECFKENPVKFWRRCTKTQRLRLYAWIEKWIEERK